MAHGVGIYGESRRSVFSFAKNSSKPMPTDSLGVDVMRMEALGYGCHYGNYKADHPNTREENEAFLREIKAAPTKNTGSLRQGVCERCGTSFITRQKNRRFCSPECQKLRYDQIQRECRARKKEGKKND